MDGLGSPRLSTMGVQRTDPMNPLLWPLRSLANGLGMAWWARVQTHDPEITYWFGPFVRRQELDAALQPFLDDLRREAPGSLDHAVLRTRRGEPLTIDGRQG